MTNRHKIIEWWNKLPYDGKISRKNRVHGKSLDLEDITVTQIEAIYYYYLV